MQKQEQLIAALLQNIVVKAKQGPQLSFEEEDRCAAPVVYFQEYMGTPLQSVPLFCEKDSQDFQTLSFSTSTRGSFVYDNSFDFVAQDDSAFQVVV